MRVKHYAGIDGFRLIAALLVVAIHTSPLKSISGTGDFILTRMIARTAVPFFFMTSGFFLISRYADGSKRLLRFLQKTAVIYGISTLIYLPVNLYTGYFGMKFLLPNLLKDLVFDGTFYHLWYLPASMLGAVIAWYLLRKSGYKKAFLIALLLYAVGLFGDSYYGISAQIPLLKHGYQALFELSDYTRNGVFFAPVFFLTGAYIADEPRRPPVALTCLRLAVCLLFLFAEALTLHFLELQRHDSMYIFLLPTMYFLFELLLRFEGKRLYSLRTIALIVYLIHPLVILSVRLSAKLFRLQNLLVNNSPVHFIVVSAVSVGIGILTLLLWERFLPAKPPGPRVSGERAYIELNLKNLEHNVRTLENDMPDGCELMAVVKTEAYGHGLFEISVCLARLGVRAFAVATIDEGIRLRRYGIRGDILILGYTDPRRAPELAKYQLAQTVISYDYAVLLNAQRRRMKVHIKIDTGMHRLGIDQEDLAGIEAVFSMKYLKVCGIFSHLCCPDSAEEEDRAFTRAQADRFFCLVNALKERGFPIPKLHLQSSYGLLNYPQLPCDYVRAGIALYGCMSSPDDTTALAPGLRPVLALKSRVVLIRFVRQGESVGYSRCFMAERDSRIAVLPIGYGDGIPRSLSCGVGRVSIRGHLVPIIGKICMDQLMVDLTDADDVEVGDTATLIDNAENRFTAANSSESVVSTALSAAEMAQRAGSISNELLCRLGARLPIQVS